MNTLGLVSNLAGKQTHLPILNNVYLVATEAKVEILGTNLEMAIKASLRAKVDEVGAFTVPAKTLSDYIHLLPDEKVDFVLEGSEMLITSGNSSTKIKGAPGDEFPVMPEIEEEHAYVVDVEKIKEALSKTVVAAAKNEIRPELSGIYAGFFTERHKGLVFAATDSYRLSEVKINVAQGEDEVRIIIPARTVHEMIRLFATHKGEQSETQVRIWVSENQVALRYNNFEMTSRLIDGKYPDYAQIIPQDFKTKSIFPVGVMINKIKAAGLFTTTGVNAVSLDLNVQNNTIGVSSTSTQTGQHDSVIDAEVKGEENSILLNHRYVLDGLQFMDGEVELKINSSDAPCMFNQKGKDDFTYIVMPIRQ